MKHPQIGKLYEFALSDDVAVHVTPVEYVTGGMFKGALMCYVFRPELSAERIYANAGADDLVIPAIITVKDFFRNGTFRYVASESNVNLPLFRQHGFCSWLSKDDNLPKKFFDLSGNKLDSDILPDHIAQSALTGPPDICKDIASALNLDIDCERHSVNREEIILQMQLPADDHVNRRSMYLLVQVSHDPDACVDPDQDIMGIEDALEAALGAGKLGSFVGNGVSETDTEFFLKIRPKMYPEAIRVIRKAMRDVGVLKYTVLWDKD
jgi:hypothetical protein